MDDIFNAKARPLPEETVGIDEAGRGCLAGSVVACAVILPPDHDIPGLNDSKKLTAEKRDELAVLIKARALAWSLGQASAREIDELNILQATFLAMRRAFDGLKDQTPRLILVDGDKTIPGLDVWQQAVVDGDGIHPCISAASILAKTHRDAQMVALDEKYPQYGFAGHKGYGTKAHRQAIQEHGPCPEHRKTFAGAGTKPPKAKGQWLPLI